MFANGICSKSFEILALYSDDYYDERKSMFIYHKCIYVIKEFIDEKLNTLIRKNCDLVLLFLIYFISSPFQA